MIFTLYKSNYHIIQQMCSQFYAAESCVTTRFFKNVGHLQPAEFTNHLYRHWAYLQQNDIFRITLMRGVTEKKRQFSRYQLILLQRVIILNYKTI